MLVLTRRIKETVHIGDNIIVHVLRLPGGSVRLGIEAPREVLVDRGETIAKRLQADLDAAGGLMEAAG